MKILITPQFGIGDALMTTPAIKLLKEYKPDFEIHVLTMKKAIYDLFLKNPYIDQLIYFPLLKKNKLEILKFILTTISFKYDCVINFYPSNRAAYNIFALLTFAKKRIGHSYLHSNLTQLNFLKNYRPMELNALHCVEENVRLLEFFGIKLKRTQIPEMLVMLSTEEIKKAQNYLNQFPTPRIGIHTGSSTFKNHRYRRWPKEYFLEVINNLSNYQFFLFGTDEEKIENDFIFKNHLYDNVTIVKTKNIRETAAIIKGLDLFVSNDSGLMHLSAAVGTKTIGIFGPTNPVWVKPWGKQNAVVKAEIPCAPCFVYSPKPLVCKNYHKWACLKKLDPQIVLHTIEKVL